jgi:hypothetical protein
MERTGRYTEELKYEGWTTHPAFFADVTGHLTNLKK